MKVDKQIEAIVSADKIRMDSFIGYEDERAKVVANTKAFVEGRPAANTLLCGDAGTGNFRPNDEIVRSEACVIFTRIAVTAERTK